MASGRLRLSEGGVDIVRIVDEAIDAMKPVITDYAPGNLSRSLDREAYVRSVEDVLEFIRSGSVYQLSLSIRYSSSMVCDSVMALFWGLFEKWPAAYYSRMLLPDYELLSRSPEKFLTVSNGRVLSRPIKGTLAFDRYQSELEGSLRDSEKESAELSMIVDLIRNDISRSCSYGSVKVSNHKSIFKVDNLLQMYSDVSGVLKPGADVVDLLFDCFPGGSITGCPKSSALQLIDKLEPHSREIYTGSFFEIVDEHNMDSSIAIRTASRNRKTERLDFWAGSGIVIDSDPHSEFLETEAKAEKFIAAIS